MSDLGTVFDGADMASRSVYLLDGPILAASLVVWRSDKRKTREEAREGHERLAERIIELYEGGASTGTDGAEAVKLFLEVEEELERDPGEALKKIERALALIEKVERRRRSSAPIEGGKDEEEARQTWSR